jgi:hypothetical protein
MKRTPLQWFVAKAAIPLAMLIAGAAFGQWQMTREVNAYSYATLAKAYPQLKAPLQAKVREAMAGGSLTERQYGHLLTTIINENGGVEIVSGRLEATDEKAQNGATIHYRQALLDAFRASPATADKP